MSKYPAKEEANDKQDPRLNALFCCLILPVCSQAFICFFFFFFLLTSRVQEKGNTKKERTRQKTVLLSIIDLLYVVGMMA